MKEQNTGLSIGTMSRLVWDDDAYHNGKNIHLELIKHFTDYKRHQKHFFDEHKNIFRLLILSKIENTLCGY